MRRFIGLTLSCALLSTALLALGWMFAPTVGSEIGQAFGLEMLYFSGPSELRYAQLEFGLACAIAPLLTWVALFVHRIRAHVDAPNPRVAIYFAIPAIAVLCGMAARIAFLANTIAVDTPDGFAVMVGMRQLLPSWAGIEAGAIVGGLLILWVGLFTRPPA